MTVVSFPGGTPKSRKDYLGECLHDCLPANSYNEILEELEAQYDEKISVGYLGSIITYVRKNSKRFGYTIPHAVRGILAVASEGFRFQAIHLDSSRDPYMDEANLSQVRAGLVATVRTIHTMEQNEAVALLAASRYVERPVMQRAWRSYVKHLRRAAEDMEELMEEMNGGAAS